jgi:hypothetical protein
MSMAPTLRAIDEAICKKIYLAFLLIIIVERYNPTKIPNVQSTINIKLGGFPKAMPKITGIVSTVGSLWFYCPPMFNFMILLTQIVAEKESKLHLCMRTMGLKDSTYWISWLLASTITNIISSLLVTVTGTIVRLDFFVRTNFLVIFTLFFLFSMSLVPLAFLIASLVSKTRTATVIGFVIFAIGLILQLIFTNVSIHLLYTTYAPPIFAQLFNLFTPYNYAKIFADVNEVLSLFGS